MYAILFALSLGLGSVSAISCITPGATQTATWTNTFGQTCYWTGTVGANLGTNSAGGE